MGDITKGYTFTDGGTVNAASLHSLVESGTINAAFVTGKTAEASPASADQFLMYDDSATALKKISYSALSTALSAGVTIANIKKAITQNSHGLSVGEVITRTAAGAWDEALAQCASHTFDEADVNTGTDRITVGSHGITNGEPVLLKSGTTLPAPLVPGNRYYAKKIDADTIELYSDSGLSSIVNLTDDGTGTHTIFYAINKVGAVGVVSAVADSNNFTVTFAGEVTGLSGLTDGEKYFLSAATAGAVTASIPSGVGEFAVAVMVATSTTTAIVNPHLVCPLTEDSVRGEHVADKQIAIGHLTASLQAAIQRNPNSNRQMVLAGSISSVTGLADFLTAGSGLQVVLNASSSEPVIANIANGSDTEDGMNFLETITSNATFDSLTASAELFLYIDRDASGTLTYGFTNRAPHAGFIKSALRYRSIVPPVADATDDRNGDAHGFTITASSTAGGQDAYKAFDGNLSTGTAGYWQSSAVATDSDNHWISVQLPYPKVVNGFAITADANTNAPSNFKLQGSNDGSTWTDIKSVSAAGFTDNERKVYDTGITNVTAYSYYRIFVSAVAGGGTTACRITDISLFEAVDHFYHIGEGVMYYTANNGSAWTAKNRVFVGEVRTNGAAPTAIVAYQPNQRFASDKFTLTASTATEVTHNLGVPPEFISVQAYVRENDNFPWVPVNGIASISSNNTGAQACPGSVAGAAYDDRNICTVYGGAKVMAIAMFPVGMLSTTSIESCQCRVVVTRNF
jgi:hypothetical protein